MIGNKFALKALSASLLLASVSLQAEINNAIELRLEEPNEGSVMTGIANLRGWAVAPVTINQIEWFLDGKAKGIIPYGGNRDDVGAQFPQLPNSELSGYASALNYSLLSDGAHTLRVRAIDVNGNHNEVVISFNVTRFKNSFIKGDNGVSIANANVSKQGETILFGNVDAEGAAYNVALKWNPATQRFDPTDITLIQESVIQEPVATQNQAPTAANDSGTITQDSSKISLNVLANDADPEQDTLTIVSVTNPGNGTAVIENGRISYTPSPGFLGTDQFSYTVEDGHNNQSTAIVTIIVQAKSETPSNEAPQAAADTITVTQGSDNSIDVLKNDTDPEGNTLTITHVTQPAHGTTKIVNNKIVYAPASGYSGPDQFSYTVNDGHNGETTVKVTITVEAKAVNQVPVAVKDALTVTQDSSNNSINVLANDTDADTDPLTITNITQPDKGGIAVIKQGNIEYTPKSEFLGEEKFSYTISDGQGGQSTTTVTITVTAKSISSENQPPVAKDDTRTVDQGTSHHVSVLNNDSDPDGNPLTITHVTKPDQGGTAVSNAGKIDYSPAPGFSGVEQFRYTVSDGKGGESTATVTMTVKTEVIIPPNQQPVAKDDTRTVDQDSRNNSLDVLTNDTDADGDTLTITNVTQPAHGSAVIANGKINYTPAPNYSGSDSFKYTVSDGKGGQSIATVAMTVKAKVIIIINQQPIANNDVEAVAQDSRNNGFDVLTNDTDADGDTLTITSVTQPAHGSAVIVNGKINYTPAPNYSGADSFKYTVNDGKGGQNTATVTITVKAKVIIIINQQPVAKDDIETVTQDSLNNSLDVLTNDTDPDGDSLIIASVTQPAHGSVVIANSKINYTPTANYSGSDSFKYTVSDGKGGQSIATVTMTVKAKVIIPINQQPVAKDDIETVTQDSLNNSLDVLTNDTDPDEDTLTITEITIPANGTARMENDKIRYTPPAGFSGTDQFSYTIDDGNGNQDTATVTITVKANPVTTPTPVTPSTPEIPNVKGIWTVTAGLTAGSCLLPNANATYNLTTQTGENFSGTITSNGLTVPVSGQVKADGSYQSSSSVVALGCTVTSQTEGNFLSGSYKTTIVQLSPPAACAIVQSCLNAVYTGTIVK